MVWKPVRVCLLICLLAAILAQPIAASAASYTPYDGDLPSAYVTLFRDIVGKISPFSDYVFFRAGEHEYMLVFGDISLNGMAFDAAECSVYRIVIDPNDIASYQYLQMAESDFSLDADTKIVYSNLGPYPDLIDRTSFYSFASLVLLLVCVFMYLARNIFGFSLRRR